MIRNRNLKSLFIPIVAVPMAIGSGLFSINEFSISQRLFSLTFFLFTAYIIRQGTVTIRSFLLTKISRNTSIIKKMTLPLFATIFYGTAVTIVALGLWHWIIFKTIFFIPSIKTAGLTALAIFIVSLVYEIITLSADLEVSKKEIRRLERERTGVETSTASDAIDPHFLFNNLNALAYLVREDQHQASDFVHKFSNVLKYLLVNRQKELITLEEELRFLEDYYFLLKVRFEDAIQVKNCMEIRSPDMMLIPFTFQSLVDHAMKQGFFTEKEPLTITIHSDGTYLIVSCFVRPKPNRKNSTKTNLDNLNSKYQLIVGQEIMIQENNNSIEVKIPLVSNVLSEQPLKSEAASM